ncbi:MAG: ferredoxin [Candidatus Kerfeldbacteria bacterium]|nr:ferredoxin [Candidatus Kerfeldbacteria bacterium]
MSQPSESRITKIEVDRELCIGAATCVSLLPEVFQLDAENKAIATPRPGVTDEQLLDAAKACPVAAIFLYDAAGRRRYPES